MSPYEILLSEYEQSIHIKETNLDYDLKGLYHDGKILIDKSITEVNKYCILAEKIGHHFKTVGVIVKQNTLNDIKQENRGREWGYNKIFSLEQLIEAKEAGCLTKYEVIDFLNITEEFYEETIQFYFNKYGKYVHTDNHTIYFEPLNIVRNRDING
ncbi:ImmA/IrrE family metallo-endopeptidase [Cytobacillus sp. FSL R7-0696]|uniref:ImmA/IrrE family metallo-endopeptidase n=1 Tax=Cytobacillus sp. FSL R7-0696 TaxID=2921691 RepID=UPI0030F8C7DA